jgi:hypothetical protein
MMMVFKMIATKFGDGVQLVVRRIRKSFSRPYACAIEFIVGIVHLIKLEDGLQATFVEGFVVSDKG